MGEKPCWTLHYLKLIIVMILTFIETIFVPELNRYEFASFSPRPSEVGIITMLISGGEKRGTERLINFPKSTQQVRGRDSI